MKAHITNFFKSILYHIDLSKHIAHHLVGPDHTITHRRNIGIVVMSVGILITKFTFFQHCIIANFMQDIVGSSIHGIGLIPFVKEIEKLNKIYNMPKHNDMISMIDVINTFEKFMMAPIPGIDKYQDIGRNKLIEKLLIPFNKKEPLPFYMLGLPFKSINDRDKVLGKLPDLGEEVMIKRFITFDKALKVIGYEPGANIYIISDGFVFNDLMDVLDNTVWNYEEHNVALSEKSSVFIYDITHFYGKNHRMNEIREKLESQWAINEIELDRRINFDIETNLKYKGMIRFAEGDLAIRPYDSRNQIHKAAKRLARNMMLRDAAYSDMVNHEFSNHAVKISMHPSENDGKKYGFQLIPGNPKLITHSPWHSALAVDPIGNYKTIHKSEAVSLGMELVYKDSQPYYFSTATILEPELILE